MGNLEKISLGEMKDIIKTFLNFAGITSDRKKEVLDLITNKEKAKNCIAFLNNPEEYPKYHYGD